MPPKLSSFPTFAPEFKHCLSRMAGEQLIISTLTLLSSNIYFILLTLFLFLNYCPVKTEITSPVVNGEVIC